MVGQAHLPGPGDGAAADEARVRDGVVGRAEGPPGHQGLAGLQAPHDAVNLGGLQGLFETPGGQDRAQAPGQHGLAGPGRAHHEDVVAAGGGDEQGPFHRLLAPDVPEILVIGRRRGQQLRRLRGRGPLGAPARSKTPSPGRGVRRDKCRSPGPPRPPGRWPGG